MKKYLLVGLLLCSAVTVSATQLTHALVGETDVVEATGANDKEAPSRVLSSTDSETKMREEVTAKRQAIESKIADKKAAITEKLSGHRKDQCAKKETAINSILDNRASAARKHFDKFKAIETKLRTFVAEKSLSVENASALEVIMNDAAVSAEAAVAAVESIDFTCEGTSAASPGGIVKDQVAAAKQSLKDYRTAIKDYAIAVKASATETAR